MTTPYSKALITGASSGLGRGLALWFAKRGVTVYAAGRREEQLESLKAEGGANIIPFKLDVADADAAFERIAKLDEDCGGLELVIANAGVGEETYGKRIDWAKVHSVIRVNVAGASATLCAPLPGMVQRGRGHLVGISSIAALVPAPRLSAYGASKSYLSAFMESLRFDVEKCGIDITAIHPGFVKSEMTAKNKEGSMPFLMETVDAVELMGQAILRREKDVYFPWQTSAIAHLAADLPKSVYRLIAKRVR